MKGNILNMPSHRQWLDHGLDALPPEAAARVRLFRLAVASGMALRHRLDREMAATGVTTQQGALLQFIEAQPEPPTLGAVAQALTMTHQNVKQIAAALERKGFLTIEVDARDRRARRLHLTAHHRRFWSRRNPSDFAQVQAWTAGLSDDEVTQACVLLRRLLQSVRAADGDGEDGGGPDGERAQGVPDGPQR